MFCPYYNNKEVFDGFNRMIEMLGGRPMTEEEFKSKELRLLRTGLDYSAMEKAYELYHKNDGNVIDIEPSGRASGIYFLTIPQRHSMRYKNIALLKNYYRENKTFLERVATDIVSAKVKLKLFKDFRFHNADWSDKFTELIQREMENTIDTHFSDAEKLLIAKSRPMYTSYGKYKLDISIKTFDRVVEDRLSIIDEWSDDLIFSELQRLNTETDGEFLYHINSKKREAIKREILKKVLYAVEAEIDRALDFLDELENEQENNAYVNLCIQWMKTGLLSLPRDNDKVRLLFDQARKLRLDIQKFKTPLDLLKALLERGKFLKRENGINPLDYEGISFSSNFELLDGRTIQIYDVFDNKIGMQSIVQMLADTSPINRDGQIINYSPWCISTFNYDISTKKAKPTNSADRYWENYGAVKKQIAFFNGFPIGFNASNIGKQQWWDFNDRSHNDLHSDFILTRQNANFIDTSGQNLNLNYITLGPASIHLIGDLINTIFTHNFTIGRNNFEYSNSKIYIKNHFSIIYLEDKDYKYQFYIKFDSDSDHIEASVFIREYYNLAGRGTIKNEHVNVLFHIDDTIKEYINKLRIIYLNLLSDINIDTFDKYVNDKLRLALRSIESIYKDLSLYFDSYISKFALELNEKEKKSLEEAEKKYKLLKEAKDKASVRKLIREDYITNLDLNDSSYHAEEVYNLLEDALDTAEDLVELELLLHLYDKYITKPVNKSLNKKLKKILKKFHFEVLEEPLGGLFGENILGAFDFLQKLIYITEENTQNAITFPEEFAHAFIKMMGAVYHKPGNREGDKSVTKVYSELVDLIKNTNFYKEIYEEYKNTPGYQYENGKPAENKIAEEALGKALALVIIDKYNNLKDRSFFEKVKDWFKVAINTIKNILGLNEENYNSIVSDLNQELNNIADSILDNTYYVKYLKKINDKKYKLLNYYKTIKHSIKKDNGIALRIMKFMSDCGGVITGSMAYRKQGTVYRDKIDELHDIDVMFAPNTHGINFNLFKTAPGTVSLSKDQILDIIRTQCPQALQLIDNFQTNLENYNLMYAYLINNGHTLIFNIMCCDDASLVNRFMGMSGQFTERLKNFTGEERKKMYLVDVFFNDSTVSNDENIVRDDIYGLNLVYYTIPFEAKLKMSRAKDLYDYQNFKPSHRNTRTPNNNSLFRQQTQNTETIDSSSDTNIQHCLQICKKLLKKLPNLNVKVISEQEIPNGVDKRARSFIKDDTIYLIEGRVTTEDTIEEFMHSVVYTIAQSNYNLYQLLLREAKAANKDIWDDVQTRYTEEDGWSEEDREYELLAKCLAKYSNSIFKEDFNAKGWKSIAKKALNLFKSLILNLYKREQLDLSSLKNMTLRQLSDHISNDKIIIKVDKDSKIRYSLNKSTNTAQKLTQRVKILYDTYEKMPNKSARRQKIQNELYELLGKMKSHLNYEAAKDFLNYAVGRLFVLNEDGSINTTDRKTIYGWLLGQSQLGNKFAGCTPEILVDVYTNGIGFFKDVCDKYLITGTFDGIEPSLKLEIEGLLSSVKSCIENEIMPLWRLAIGIAGDRIIEDYIDKNVALESTEDYEDMKTVVKDYLHKNAMYGDIKGFLDFIYNFGQSNSPIIQQAFHLILNSESKTQRELTPIATKLTKQFRRASSLFNAKLGSFEIRAFLSSNTRWQTMFMEFDKDGIPTGNFIRDINYGQYEKDLEEFIQSLNKEFDSAYGYHYVTDKETGTVVNSVSGEDAFEEEWINGNMPVYALYLRAIEEFKCERTNRRYTSKYYEERLSEPYKGSLDPNDVDVNSQGHGLSLKTLREYNRILSNIDYYLNMCTDPKTGVAKPEDLSPENMRNLDQWYKEMEDLQSPYTLDEAGNLSLKRDDALKMAFEIRAWNKWLSNQTNNSIDYTSFREAEQKAKEEAAAKNDQRILYNFYKYNAEFGINQDFLNLTIGSYVKNEPFNHVTRLARMIKDALFSLTKKQNRYERDLERFKNNPKFWLLCREMDVLIEQGKVKQDPKYAEILDLYFTFEEIIYRDEYGFAIDLNGRQIMPQDEKRHNDLLTYRQYLINYYTNLILNSPTRTLPGLNDHNGQPFVFTGNSSEIKQILSNEIFNYPRTRNTKDGAVLENSPLSIFIVMKPKLETFVNVKTGLTEKTSDYIPKSRFATRINKTSDSVINTDYIPNTNEAELPKREYYDNSENFNKIKGEYKNLYDMLIQTMQDMQKLYSTSTRFNYRLPQIEASTMLILSRLLLYGWKNTAKTLLDSMTNIEENDDNMRTTSQLLPNPDGSIAQDVPLKFIHRLKHPERITTDITGAVIAFARMAITYKNRSEIEGILKTLRYNLDYNTRMSLYQQADEEGPEPINASNQTTQFDALMDTHFYGNQWKGTDKQGLPIELSKAEIASKKAAKNISRFETIHMLGWNLFSMTVGGLDAFSRFVKETIAHRYITPRDGITALLDCIKYTPFAISNIGNPVPNNKLSAMMHQFGIAKSGEEIWRYQNRGRVKKILSLILMGPFTMIDWMVNALLFRANANHVRFYDGGKVPTGFYTRWELSRTFKRAGYKRATGKLAWSLCTTTLWNAYHYDHGIVMPKKFIDKNGNERSYAEFLEKNNEKILNDIRTKTLQRGALINGMNPDNDTPRWKTNPATAPIFALRSFLTQQYQHLFAGRTDNVVRSFSKRQNEEVKRNKTIRTESYTKDKLTQALKNKRFSWNYETGTYRDLIGVGLWRIVKKVCDILYRVATFNMLDLKNIRFSTTEAFALLDSIIYLGTTALQGVAWTYYHDSVLENLNNTTITVPKNRNDAAPENVYNPIDWYNHIKEHFIGDNLYQIALDDVLFRTIESQISNIDPFLVMDIVNSITALKSGIEDHIAPLSRVFDIIGVDNEEDEEVKQGKYKYFTKNDRQILSAIGPIDNLITTFTYFGTKTNLQWYMNSRGKFFRFFGYDLTTGHTNNTKSKSESDLDLNLDIDLDLDLDLDLSLDL